MQLPTLLSRRTFWIAQVLLIFLGILGIFLLPWYFPSAKQVDSLSYIYGFNNKVAWLTALLVVCTASVFRIARAVPSTSSRTLSKALAPPAYTGDQRSLRTAAFALIALVSCAALAWFLVVPYSAYGEMANFIPRLELMALGYRPYSQFDFIYGPLLAYPQLWVYRLGAGWISIEAAYATVFVADVAVGLWFVYFSFRQLGGATDLTRPFLAIAVPAAIGAVTLGLNGTLIRFAAPLAFLLFVQSWTPSKGTVTRSITGGMVTLLAFLISPEIGIVSLAGLASYFVLRRDVMPALSCFVAIPAVILIGGIDYFAGMFQFGGGAGNFPIFPTIYVVVYLLCLITVLPELAFLEISAEREGRGLAGALFFLILASVPIALGRCDGGHLFLNGLALFILALATAYNFPGRHVRTAALIAFTILFLGIGLLNTWVHYGERIVSAAKLRWGITKQRNSYWLKPGLLAVEHPRLIESKPSPQFWSDLTALQRYESLAVPLRAADDVERYLKVTGRYSLTYHANPLEIFTEGAVERELAALRRQPWILVSEFHLHHDEEFDEQSFNASASHFLSALLLYPVSFQHVRNRPFVPPNRIRDHIRKHFEVVEHWRTYAIMRPLAPVVTED